MAIDSMRPKHPMMLMRHLPLALFQFRQALRTGIAVLIAVVLQQLFLADVAQAYWLMITAVFLPQMLYGNHVLQRVGSMIISGVVAMVLCVLGVWVQAHFLLESVYLAVVLLALTYLNGRFKQWGLIPFYIGLLTVLSVGLPAVLSDALPRGAMIMLGGVLAVAVSCIAFRTPQRQQYEKFTYILYAMVDFMVSADRYLTDEKYYSNRQSYERQLMKRRYHVMELFDMLDNPENEQNQQVADLLQQLFASMVAFANVRFRYHSAGTLLAMRDGIDSMRDALVEAINTIKKNLHGRDAQLHWSTLTTAAQRLQAISEQALAKQRKLGSVEWVFESEAEHVEVIFEAESAHALHALVAVVTFQLDILKQLYSVLDASPIAITERASP